MERKRKVKWLVVDVVRGKKEAIRLAKKIEREGFFSRIKDKGKGFFTVLKSAFPKYFYFTEK